MELVKQSITKSFIHSWTSHLDISDDTVEVVSGAVNHTIDDLLSLVSSRHVSIYHFITDLIHGAHLHIIR